MQPPQKVSGTTESLTAGLRALSLSSRAVKRSADYDPLQRLVQILETIPDVVGGEKALVGKVFFSGTKYEILTPQLYAALTDNGKIDPGFCIFYESQKRKNPSRQVVMTERDFNRHYKTLVGRIDTNPPVYDVTTTATKIQSLVLDSISQIAGEALLMLLVCMHIVSQKATPNRSSIHLIKTLSMLAPNFFQGPHLISYSSLYSELDWFCDITQLFQTGNACYFSILIQCITITNAALIPKQQQGLFSQASSSDPHLFYHPCHLEHITRFHDWYALCFKLADLVDEESLIRSLLEAAYEMPKSYTFSIGTLLSMFSILEMIRHGISLDCWRILSQPEMTFEKWQGTKYFKYFCLKILLYYPYDVRSHDKTVAITNILQGLCFFAPFFLHDQMHLFLDSHFSNNPWFAKIKESDKDPLISLIDTCHRVVTNEHKNPLTLKQLHEHSQPFITRIPISQYFKMCIDAIFKMPNYKENLVYHLCILSFLNVKKSIFLEDPDLTLEKWKISQQFAVFCLELFNHIETHEKLVSLLSIFYDSGIDIAPFIQAIPEHYLQHCQNLFICYLENCHNSKQLLFFLKELKQKGMDINFLLVKLSLQQFIHLIESIEDEPTLFFPGILLNEEIPFNSLRTTFARALQRLVNTRVSFLFITKCLHTLNIFSEKWQKEHIPIVFEEHIRALLAAKWSLCLKYKTSIPQVCMLYTQDDFRKKIIPTIETACLLAPSVREFIYEVFVEKVIDFIIKNITYNKDGIFDTLLHIYTHFYPIISELLLPLREENKRNQTQQLSILFFKPFFFYPEFSNAIVCATKPLDTVEEKIQQHVTLFINLVSTWIDSSKQQQHDDLVYKTLIDTFINEITTLAVNARRKNYPEAACTERIIAKNSLMRLIATCYSKITDPDAKWKCFNEIGRLKHDELQISPQPSPRELLGEKGPDNIHAFLIQETGIRLIFESPPPSAR